MLEIDLAIPPLRADHDAYINIHSMVQASNLDRKYDKINKDLSCMV